MTLENEDEDINVRFGEDINKNDKYVTMKMSRIRFISITNTQFQHKNKHRYTWEERRGTQIFQTITKAVYSLVSGKFLYMGRNQTGNIQRDDELEN